MPTWLYRGSIDPATSTLRDEVRPSHLAYQALQDNLAGGPLLDDDGNAIGSMVIFEADDRDQAAARVAADPYVKEGVITDWTLDVLVRALWPEVS